MSLLFWRPSTGTGEAPVTTLDVPTIHARVAWRGEGFSTLPWDGTSTTGWITAGTAISGDATSIATTSSDSFGGGSSLELVTAGTASSGVDFAVPGTAVSGREYTFRVALRNVSGSTSTILRVGNASDYALSTATITTGWAWYTQDWTPGTAVTDAYVSIQNGAAATQTTRLDHPEFYEKDDEVVLESLRVTRGSRFDGSGESPGTIDMTILDPDGTYTPRNAASPLAALLAPGRRIHVRAVHGGRLHAVAYGVIESLAYDPDRKVLVVGGKDGLGELDDYSVTREFSLDGAVHAARASALAGEALAATQHDLATDSLESSPFADGTDDRIGLIDFLDELNEMTGTVHYCAPHVEAVRPWRYKTITRTTLTDSSAGLTLDDDMQRLSDVSIRDESLLTRQRVSWVGYERRPSQVVVEATEALPYWTFADEDYGSSETPQPETIYALRRRIKTFRGVHEEKGKDPVKWKQKRVVRRRKAIGRRWVDAVLPIAIASGGTAVEVVDFQQPMQDVSVAVTDGGNITTTLTKEPARVTITMVATGGADTVTAIAVTASPRMAQDEAVETVTSGTPVRERGSIDSERIYSRGAASGLATYLTWRFGASRYRPEFVDQHHMARQLSLDVGSHVTLSADRWGIDADRYVIRSLEHEVGAGGWAWTTTYGLEELPSGGAWFTLGSSLLDGTDVLAY